MNTSPHAAAHSTDSGPDAAARPDGAAGAMTASDRRETSFRERMHPAAWWWLVALVFWLSVTIAVWAYLDWAWAVGATLAVALLSGSWILQLGMVVRADASGLRAGRNRIEWRWIASAKVLDAASTTAYLNNPAHHRVFLAVRPYVKQSVLFTLADPADPHPAWIVSTRRPEQLAALAAERIELSRRG